VAHDLLEHDLREPQDLAAELRALGASLFVGGSGLTWDTDAKATESLCHSLEVFLLDFPDAFRQLEQAPKTHIHQAPDSAHAVPAVIQGVADKHPDTWEVNWVYGPEFVAQAVAASVGWFRLGYVRAVQRYWRKHHVDCYRIHEIRRSLIEQVSAVYRPHQAFLETLPEKRLSRLADPAYQERVHRYGSITIRLDLARATVSVEDHLEPEFLL